MGIRINKRETAGKNFSKEARKAKIKASTSYKIVKGITTLMDKYFLDPILGIIPGAGDLLSSIFIMPFFLYVSIVKIRSLPLTLAIIFNKLVDVLLGLFPWLGDIADIFYRSNLQNFKLINGFVDEDKEVIKETNKKAVWMGVGIVVVCILIYLLFGLLGSIVEGVGNLMSH